MVAVAELTRLVLPALARPAGRWCSSTPGPGRRAAAPGGSYAASKHALVAVAEALRLEEPQVRVTTVFPGRVATDTQRELHAYEGDEYDAGDYLQPTRLPGSSPAPCDGVLSEVSVVAHR